MPRKRKIPRSGGEVIPLQYSKGDFESPKFTIVKYTQSLRYRNRHMAQRDLSEEEVREQYALALLSVYHPDDAEYQRLVDQVESPAYHDYWTNLADRHSYLQQRNAKDPTTGFWISGRILTPAKTQQYPHCVLMEHETLGLIIVPDLNLRALYQVVVKDLVKPILEANTDIPALHLFMRPLCEAIIRRVYIFEEANVQQSKLDEMNSWEQDVGPLLEGYRLAYANNPENSIEEPTDSASLDKGKKRLAEEELEPQREKALADEGRGSTEGGEDEEDGTAGDGPGPSKRSKRSKSRRSNLEEGGWLDFEKELGSASASTPAAPVSFEFQNMTLPFRNKD